MIALAKSVWTAVTARRDWLTLLAVAGVAAWLYVQYAQVRRDRNVAIQTIIGLCAIAGEPVIPGDRIRKDSAAACADRLRQLVRFEREALAESNRVLAEHQADQLARSQRDAARASADAASARSALQAMEEENARIEQDRVGGPWFDALNRLAGLRDGAGGTPRPGGDRGETR